MRHLIAITAALGFLFAVNAPTSATTFEQGTVIELSAQKKKVDCKKTPKAKECKKTDLGTTTLAAATKKVDCKDPKNKNNKACKKK